MLRLTGAFFGLGVATTSLGRDDGLAADSLAEAKESASFSLMGLASSIAFCFAASASSSNFFTVDPSIPLRSESAEGPVALSENSEDERARDEEGRPTYK